MDKDDKRRIVETIEKHGVKFFDIKIVDFTGRWRHVTVPVRHSQLDVIENGIGFDASNYGYKGISESDMLFIPDPKTAKLEHFGERKAVSMTGDIYEVDEKGKKTPFSQDPRRTARKAIEYMRKSNIAHDFYVNTELEFYVFDKVEFGYTCNRGFFEVYSNESRWGTPNGEKLGFSISPGTSYHAPQPNDRFADLRDEIALYLAENGISVQYHHHEIGSAGEMEIELTFGDLLNMADNTLFVKYAIKNIAYQRGKSATFMPKPLYGQPGNGMHIHQYMTKDGGNIFYDPKGYRELSKDALYYIGGLLKHGPSLMAFTNPSTSSFKRLVPGHEAPVSFTFGGPNRSVAIRIPGYITDPLKKRIEFRIIDATCNPYLAYSAMLMAGLDGIINKIDPVEEGYGPYEENLYGLTANEDIKLKKAPKSLEEALQSLERDHGYLSKGEVFTEEQIQAWIALKQREVRAFYDKPHPYEYILYYDM